MMPLDHLCTALLRLQCHTNLASELLKSHPDDHVLGGKQETVLSDFRNFEKSRRLLGLEVNASKCEVYFDETRETKMVLRKDLTKNFLCFSVLPHAVLSTLGHLLWTKVLFWLLQDNKQSKII